MFLMVFVLMTAAWFAVGIEGTFQPNSWEVTGLWNVLMLVAAIVAAVAGGYVAALIARDPQGPYILMGIVVVLGVVGVLVGMRLRLR
jgi:anti-sigma-K factor RskA